MVLLDLDRKSTRLNSSHSQISYAVFCLKKKKHSAITHAIAVNGTGINKTRSTVRQSNTSTITVSLKPGTSPFYCPVDFHQASAITGHLPAPMLSPRCRGNSTVRRTFGGEEDPGTPPRGARDRHHRALPGGQIPAALPDLGVVPGGNPFEEVGGPPRQPRRPDVVVAS